MPWIDTLLASEAFSLVARLVLTAFFWIAGVFGLVKPKLIAPAVANAGLPAPRSIAALMIATELGGSALLVSDIGGLGWLGAGWLGVFTLLSIPLGHPFWKYPPPEKMAEFLRGV